MIASHGPWIGFPPKYPVIVNECSNKNLIHNHTNEVNQRCRARGLEGIAQQPARSFRLRPPRRPAGTSSLSPDLPERLQGTFTGDKPAPQTIAPCAPSPRLTLGRINQGKRGAHVGALGG